MNFFSIIKPIDSKKKSLKFSIIWKLNKTPVNNPWVEEKPSGKYYILTKWLKKNQNLWDASIEVLREIFICLNTYIKKE